MTRALRALFTLVAALPAAAAAAEDVPGALARLASDSAAERATAQRWLAVNLSRDDLPLVAEAARGGGVEVRRRIAQALGTDDRHLDLASLLATDRDPLVAALGERAITELAAGWSTSVLDAPAKQRTVPDEWEEDRPQPLSLDPEAGSLADVVEVLARFGGGPAPLVLDPSLDAAVRTRIPDRPRLTRRLEGPWCDVLRDLARRHRVSFEVLGHREEDAAGAAGARPWVRVCKRGDESDTHAARHLVEWCRGLSREHDPSWNAACARALAMTGWPAPVAWLEVRWTRDGDPAALEGLFTAAARGAVAPSLARPAVIRSLLAEGDRRLAGRDAGSSAFAERLAAALAQVGPVSPGGESLADVLLEGWSTLAAPARWVRLVALEGQGAAHPASASACRRELAEVGPLGLRMQALRTLVRVDDGHREPVPVADAARLFARARHESRLDELARNLLAAGAVPAEGWTAVAAGTDAAEGLALLRWCAGSELPAARARAAELLAALARAHPPQELAPALARWDGLGGSAALRELFVRAADPAARPAERRAAPALERLALHAGLLGERERAAALARIEAEPTLAPADLADLGALAGSGDGVGARARELLEGAVESGAPVDDLTPAVELAVRALRRARLDGEDEAFQGRLRSRASRSGHPLRDVLARKGWPPGPAVALPPLERSERRLDL